VEGEIISHGRSGDAIVCPCRAIVRRVRHLLELQQPPTTPICKYFHNSTPSTSTTTNIRAALRTGLQAVSPNTLGIQPHEIDARSLRAGGATALLCANIAQNTIQLLGRWKSDAMIRYLHVSANPQVYQYARQMFAYGQASFAPS
jgi:hypothetical protein